MTGKKGGYFWLIGALIGFWIVLEPGWLSIIGRFSDEQIMTIGSPERNEFFGFVKALLLAAFITGYLGYLSGRRFDGFYSARPKPRWVTILLGIIAWGWLAMTLFILFSGLLAASQPGIKHPQPDPSPSSSPGIGSS